MLGVLAISLVSGWTGPGAARGSGYDFSKHIVSRPHGGSISVDGAQRTLYLVPLSAEEMTALGLSAQEVYSADQVGVRQQQAPPFAHPAFQRTWERTDRLVASGQVQRSWYWGPAPNTGGLMEDYAQGQGGKRLVQYFDKSRMEINNPGADPNNPFFVTNGLLTVELISGKMQVGDTQFVDRWPAEIPLASDPDDPNAPTYRSFLNVTNTTLGDHPAPSRLGQPVTATITRSGTIGDDPIKQSYPGVRVAYYEQTTRHNIPEAIWNFLNESGPIYDPQTGRVTSGRLTDPWVYAFGLPISEAYWAQVKIAGQMQDVLIQAFERRVVTYVPNGVPGFKVQVGNIGQHYYDWRYKNAGRPSGPLPLPTATPGGPTATPTPPPVTPTATPTPNPAADCSNIPQSINMTVSPNCGPGGTVFDFEAWGFQPGENVGIYLTAPDQSVYGAPFQEPADSRGRVSGIYLESDPTFPPGIWALTMEGTSSRNKAIGYFKITAPTPSPTPGPGERSCDGIPPSQNMQILPSNCAPAGTRFLFVGRGFQPGENVGVYVTAPDQSVFGAPFQLQADQSGVAGTVLFTTQRNFPLGVWAMTMEGVSSRRVAIGYFKLIAP
jgi:hypothetical protein